MLNDLTEKLRAFAYRGLDADLRKKHPVVQHARNLVSIVNEMLGQPIRPADAASSLVTPASEAPAVTSSGPQTVRQAPVLLYFDGKDHRTKKKIEELLVAKEIPFTVLDVTDDEATRSWATTQAKQLEFPLLFVAGEAVGGLHELTQLDVNGDLLKRVFGG